ncbi:MAG: hypothetical protein FWD34_07720 [Oscillospiraceae bacterium]|nr:hypothetical protein [Oscillospiraceae bacterium]
MKKIFPILLTTITLISIIACDSVGNASDIEETTIDSTTFELEENIKTTVENHEFIIMATRVDLTLDDIFAVVDESKVDKANTALYIDGIISNGAWYFETSKEPFYGYILQYGDVYFLYVGGNHSGGTYSAGVQLVDLTKSISEDKQSFFVPDSDNSKIVGVLTGSMKPKEIYLGIYKDADIQIPVIYGTNFRHLGYQMDMIFNISTFEYLYFSEIFWEPTSTEPLPYEVIEQSVFFKKFVDERIEVIALLE